MISDTEQVDKLNDEHDHEHDDKLHEHGDEHDEVEGSQTGMIVGIALAGSITITLAVLVVLLHLT